MTAVPDFAAADMARVAGYFDGCAPRSTFTGLTPFTPLYGPWLPAVDRSLADVVAEWTGRVAA